MSGLQLMLHLGWRVCGLVGGSAAGGGAVCAPALAPHDVHVASMWTAAQEGAARHRFERFLAALMVDVLGGSMSLCMLCSCWHQWSWIALHIPLPKYPSVSLFVL